VDICIEFMMLPPPDEEISSSARGKWFQVGDPIVCYQATQMGALSGQNYTPHTLPVPMPRTRYLFVKGIVDSWQGKEITLAVINAVLADEWSENLVVFTNPKKNIFKKRIWNLWDGINNGVRNNLIADGYDTINFAQLLSSLRNKNTLNLLSEPDFLL